MRQSTFNDDTLKGQRSAKRFIQVAQNVTFVFCYAKLYTCKILIENTKKTFPHQQNYT